MSMGIVKLWCAHSMELYAAVNKGRDGSTSGVLSTSQRSLREHLAPPTTKNYPVQIFNSAEIEKPNSTRTVWKRYSHSIGKIIKSKSKYSGQYVQL